MKKRGKEKRRKTGKGGGEEFRQEDRKGTRRSKRDGVEGKEGERKRER